MYYHNIQTYIGKKAKCPNADPVGINLTVKNSEQALKNQFSNQILKNTIPLLSMWPQWFSA